MKGEVTAERTAMGVSVPLGTKEEVVLDRRERLQAKEKIPRASMSSVDMKTGGERGKGDF